MQPFLLGLDCASTWSGLGDDGVAALMPPSLLMPAGPSLQLPFKRSLRSRTLRRFFPFQQHIDRIASCAGLII
jgi:hypothetical protein